MKLLSFVTPTRATFGVATVRVVITMPSATAFVTSAADAPFAKANVVIAKPKPISGRIHDRLAHGMWARLRKATIEADCATRATARSTT